MNTYLERVEAAIKQLQNGKMIILTDHPDRENEGDLIFPAEIITAEIVNFMIRNCSGIICMPTTEAYLKKLGLSLMVAPHENSSHRGTPFTVSIEARNNISTGVSAKDRATTILTAISDTATADDLVKPGHIFPLQAKTGGVLERAGHTEGSVDLVRLAGFKPAAVLCEVMNPDGTMASGEALQAFAKQHEIMILSIEDLINYRQATENLIAEQISTTLELETYGAFTLTVVKEKYTSHEHMILEKLIKNPALAPLVRIHSTCATGDLFASKRCDCHQQLHYALKCLSEEGGMLIYLNQEGRGIGLFNKIKAYALQDQGLDTIEANQELGLPIDCRQYYMAAAILRNKQLTSIRLLTNNPAKLKDLKKYGIAEVTREHMPVFCNEHNQKYLHAKKIKLQHLFPLDLFGT
jgi:3,4-dihydroxy 2-butanone 4-phosphate synthase / GTP cyclohydrolase II